MAPPNTDLGLRTSKKRDKVGEDEATTRQAAYKSDLLNVWPVAGSENLHGLPHHGSDLDGWLAWNGRHSAPQCLAIMGGAFDCISEYKAL